MLVDFSRAPLVIAQKPCRWPKHRALAGLVLFLFLMALPAATQLPGVTTKSPPPAAAAPEQLSDPLGRSTPRGTIQGFVKAADRNDFVTAVQYLQVPGKPLHETETLARDLKELMNRYFSRPLALINDSPEGEVQDALPLDHERVGSLKINDRKFDIVLVRVANPQSGRMWLISSDTLADVPELFDAIEATWIDRLMPDILLNHTIFAISLAQWIVWSASIALPFLFGSFASRLTLVILRRTIDNEQRRTVVESWYDAVRWPAIFVLTTSFHVLVMYTLGFSLTARMIYGRFLFILLIVGVEWLFRRTTTLSFERVRASMQHTGDSGSESLVLLAERLLRVAIILAAIFTILTVVGVDTKTALAGVGIGGVAIAFGAQKTVENLLGGIFLLTDKALAIGDKCRIADRMGTVEDITLRSIRLRTPEQTILSIPAGTLSQSNIENFASRSKIPVQTTLELRYGTTTEQLKSILDTIRTLLSEDPRLEAATARVQLISYGPNSIQLELFAYVRTQDEVEFRAAREDLLLHIGQIVDDAGSGFAVPAQFFYLRPQEETEPKRTSLSDIRGSGGKNREASRALPPSLPTEDDVLPKRAS
jgi:MscS family membrane protein